MGNLIPSNNNDDNLDFNPTKLPGCKVWIDATDESTLFTTDYQGSVTVADSFVPTSISGCSSWYDSSDSSTLYNTSAGPVTAVSSPTGISGCSLWLDASDSTTLYKTDAALVTPVNSPLNISGCVAWWDGSDISTLFQNTDGTNPVTASGQLVGSWVDKASGFTARAPSTDNRPMYQTSVTNSKSAILFDGWNDYLNLSGMPSQTTETIFIVTRANYEFNKWHVILAGNSPTGYGASLFTSSSASRFRASYGGFTPGTTAVVYGLSDGVNIDPLLISLNRNASGTSLRESANTIQSSTTPYAITYNYIGADPGTQSVGVANNNVINGHICEIIIYNSDLSATDRARIESYLASKWGMGRLFDAASSISSVGTWQDKSGNNKHAIQSISDYRPTISINENNLNVINFDGTNDALLTNLTSQISQSVFVVCKYNGTSINAGRVISFGTYRGIYQNPGPVLAFFSNSVSIAIDFPVNSNNWSIASLVFNSNSQASIFGNGIGTVSSINFDPYDRVNTTLKIGQEGDTPYNNFPGSIAEIIVFDRTISSSERTSIEKYLANKWGIQGVHTQTTSSGSIGYWGDKSGNNRHARQDIGSYRPSYSGTINGLPAITFDGADDHFLIGDLSSAFPNFGEVYIVFEPNNANSYELYQTSQNYLIYRYAGGNTSQFGAFTSNRTTGTAVGIPTNGVHITTMRADASSMTVRFDGSVLWTQAGLGYNGGNYHTIGYCNQGGGGVGGIVMNGKIVEVITYNTNIGAENRAKVEQYLSRKWGIDRNLHKTSKNIGDKIGYVKDKGTEKTFLSQLNHDNRPKIGTLSNKKAIDFTQSSINSYLQSPSLTTNNHEFSFFVAYSVNNTSSTLFTLGVQDALRLISRYAGNTVTYGGTNTLGYNNTPYQLSVPKIESLIKTVGGTSSSFTKLYVNGQLATPSSTVGLAADMSSSYGWLVLSGYNSPYTFLGHNNFIIGEFIYYNRTLSDQERQLVEKYLYNKWKIDNLTYSISKPTDIKNCILWLDANDNSTLFQNPTASNNITTDGQSVAYWVDKAGGQDVAQSTVSARPTYRTNIFKDKPALYFDGGDDLLSLVNRQTTGPCTIIVVCRIDLHSGDISGILAYGDTTGGNSGPGIVYSSYVAFMDGAGAGTTTSSNSIQSILGRPSIITGIYTQNRTTNSYMYINGFLQEYYSGTGVVLASSSPRVQIGARTGGGFNIRRMIGYIAECIVYDRALTDVERASVENYLSDKWSIGSESSPSAIGSQIRLHNIKVSNKEAQNWVDRVFQNGGSVSQKTADSVNDFCNKIDAAGLRKKFYRLNLFCGNDLNACLTPLYLGPTSETYYGLRIDNNTNFLNSNYTEIDGLIAGPGSSTGGNGIFLLTGLTLSDARLSDTGHMAFYQNQFNIDTNPYNAGNRPAIGAGNSFITLQGSNNVLSYYGGYAGVETPYFGGLFLISRDSLSSIKVYEQGSLLGENSSTIPYTDQSSQVGIFTGTTGASASGSNYYYAYMKGYSVGQSMTALEVSKYDTIMENFQQSLRRGLSTRASLQFAAVTNEEAKSWIDAVYANGGSISSSTALAINNFCNSIDAAGLRNKFYRLNLFCGDTINSCLVPLYRSSSRLGIRYGNAKDLNTPVSYGYYSNSDDFNYIENQGLLGNTQEIAGNSFVSRRFLNTGLITGSISALNNNMHYSIYSKNLTNGGYPMGAMDTAGTGLSLQIGLGGYNWGIWANSLLNPTNTTTTRIFPSRKGLYIGSYANNVLTLYEGRASTIGQRDLTTTYAIPPTTLSPVGIFAENRQTTVPLFNYLDRLQGYSIGSSLTSTDVQNYYDIIQTFQAALSRAEQTVLSSTFDSITNPDARNWLTRVYENGGIVGLPTATAVQNFCNTIDSAGLRSKFFRLNLFCGENLNAATVPLYRGPNIGGTQHGFLIDINNNILDIDYNENGGFAGIKGNGSNKRLDTGLGTDFTNNSSLSFGAFISEPTSTAFSAYLGVAQNNNADTTVLYYRDGFTRGLDGTTFYPAEPTNSILLGYHAYSRIASNNYFHSWNGIAGAASTAASAARGADTFMIHALNNNGTATSHGDGRISMYHIGLGLTSAEVTTLYNAIDAFNTTMGRTRPSDSFASVTNEDAKIWIDNVYYNDGTVSSTTANLVNAFCNSIDSAGLRSKFYRVNLFCGDSLNASLVPVYRGPNKTIVYGKVKTDTNNNFILNDYSENSGLIGNGSSKWLDTGLSQNYSASRHFGCVVSKLGTTVYRCYMGAKANSSDFIADTRLNIDNTLTSVAFVGANDAGQLSTGIGHQIAEKTLVLASSSSGGANKIYSDSIGNNTIASAYSNTNTTTIGIFAQKVGQTSTGTAYTDARLSFYTIGTDLTDSEVTTLTGIVDTFNNGLNRGKPSSTFPSVTNADAKIWINRVYTNGGSVSANTANAINTLCNTIDSAGLRSKLYRFNLFCGDSLSAGLIPLYRGPSVGDFAGGYSDGNNNFNSTDYSESGSNAGLKGNGSNKYLTTGLGMNTFSISDRHLMVYESSVSTNAYATLIQGGSDYTAPLGLWFLAYGLSPPSPRYGAFGDSSYAQSPNHGTPGMFLGTGTSTSSEIYRNGVLVATASTSTTAELDTSAIIVGAGYAPGGSVVQHINGSISSYSVGNKLTSQQVLDFYNAIETFNQTIGRGRPSTSFSSVTNEDAKLWIDGVYANGGTVSSTTASAINTFCNSINSAGLRNKIYRLNLFCGNNLNASLVPVYKGPSYDGIVCGSPFDTNNNFIASDYNETGINAGLKGNGSNKYLNPGMTVLGTTGNESMSCYVIEESTTSAITYYYLGSHATSNNNRTLSITYEPTATPIQYQIEDGHTGGVFNTGLTTKTNGFKAASSSGLSLRKLYVNGDIAFTSTTTTVASTGVITPYIFCRNNNGGTYGFGNQRIGSYHIGISMSDLDMYKLYLIVQEFQTYLGRNV